jgi:hypothetical protein
MLPYGRTGGQADGRTDVEKNKDNPNQAHAKVILNKKEDCPFVIRASKFDHKISHKISLFQRQKAPISE